VHADGVSTIREAFNIIQVIVPPQHVPSSSIRKRCPQFAAIGDGQRFIPSQYLVVSGNKAFKTVDVSLSTHKASHITLGGQVGEELLRLPC